MIIDKNIRDTVFQITNNGRCFTIIQENINNCIKDLESITSYDINHKRIDLESLSQYLCGEDSSNMSFDLLGKTYYRLNIIKNFLIDYLIKIVKSIKILLKMKDDMKIHPFYIQ
jgi:sulfur relay (sulfurtransferase) DsrF/TusC family protein